jgi:tetratricopeptide (TPR) repeat protein
MKLCTVKFLVKKNTFLTFVFLTLLFIGSGMVAASMYRHYSPETSEKVNYDTLQPKKPASIDSLYKANMRIGDYFFAAKAFERAISEYENGLKLRPKDPYATDRLGKAKKQLETKIKAEMDYVKSIASGDSYFKAKDYLNAKASYQLAIEARPDDDYAKGKLKETMNLLRSMKASNILYDVAIASAEKLYQQKEYEKSMAEFENASKILPNEKYPKDRINEIIKIMVDKQTTEEMYTRSIAAADKLYNSKGYQNALLEYQHAASYKPEEQYPKDRIKELTSLLAIMKARDEAYKKSISTADKLFDDASYEPSKSEYQNASKIKPEEIYPINRIKEIDLILSRLKNAKEEYNRLVDLADSFYVTKKYINAKANYQQALKVKPNESYPKEMISKADNLISGQEANSKALEEAYQAAVSDADKLYTAKEYDKAKSGYQNALGIKPDEQYPKEKIKQIDGIYATIDKQKQQDKHYLDIIAAADKLLADKSYQPAKVQYQSALKLKPEEKYPKDRIAEIDLALTDLAKQKALDDQYSSTIVKADQSFAAKTWEQAKTDYTAASALKPNEAYPKDKILEIDKILADLARQKALDDQYNGIIANADKLLLAKTYAEARTEYSKAGDLKPSEAYPKTKIAEIDNILAAIEAQKSKDEQYKGLIEKADKLLADKSYEPAKTEYQNASAIKPAESYPKEKIVEINDVLAEIAKKKAFDDQYTSTIANADKLLADKSYQPAKVQYQSALKLKPEEKYPQDRIAEIDLALSDLAKQKALDDQYNAAIAKADQSFAAKTWEQAKTDYTAASALKPNETYPKDKILEIDKILADLARQKALDDQYNGIIANADKLLLAKTYAEARIEYGKAGDLKPSEAYPKTKIAEIDKMLADIEAQKSKDEQYKGLIEKADKLLADKSYEPAKTEYQNATVIKPAETYPKEKIAEIDKALAEIAKKKALDDQYTTTIANADKLLADKSYEPARTEYQKASQLKPEEKYPKDRIAEIELAMANLAKQKALDEQYAAIIAKADKLLLEKSYEPARVEYTNAGILKPAEQYPKDKIAEIQKALDDIEKQKVIEQKYQATIANADKLLAAKTYDLARAAFFDASGLKPAEQYPKDKMAQIDKILADIAHQKEVDIQYKASITNADQLLLSKSYEPAKKEYQNAATLKPDEQYPKGKIVAIDKILADLKAFEDKYNGAIATGDTAFNNKSYTQAKSAYQGALQMKPSEKYPKDKIAEIDKILTELAKQKVIDDQYQGSVTKADKLLADKSYAPAKTEYGNASNIKPTEQYPKDKIAEIDGIVADLKAKDDAYKASVAKANQLMAQKSYEEARAEYQNAGEIKPNEQYPKDKIAEINKILMELKGKKQTYDELVSKGNDLLLIKDFYKAKDNFQQALSIFPDESYPKERLIRINSVIDSIFRANKGFYDKAVAEGDKNFNAMVFDKAVDSYQEALSYLPMEQYPKDMINKIKRTIAENAIVDVLNSAQTVANGVEKQFDFAPVNIISRKNNYLYIKIRNLSNKPFSVMIRYGKDKQINGGAVIKNITGDGKVNERLISVREQDPWYRNDNNWISLYPQGGDVEVTFIQISRSGQ